MSEGWLDGCCCVQFVEFSSSNLFPSFRIDVKSKRSLSSFRALELLRCNSFGACDVRRGRYHLTALLVKEKLEIAESGFNENRVWCRRSRLRYRGSGNFVPPAVIACSPSWIIIDSWILQRSKTFRFISPDKTDFEGCNRWRVAIKFKATSANSFKTSFHTKFPMNEKFCLLSFWCSQSFLFVSGSAHKAFQNITKSWPNKENFFISQLTNKKLSENFAFGNYKKL